MKIELRKTTGKLIVLLMALSFFSCEEWSQDLDEVTMKVPIQKIVFEPGDANKADTASWYQKEITFDLDSLLKANDADYLDHAQIEQLELGVLKPRNQSLLFLKNVSVSISQDEDFSEEEKVGAINNVNANDQTTEFTLNPVDLCHYLRQERFYLRVYFEKRNHINIQTSTKVYVDGVIQVKIE